MARWEPGAHERLVDAAYELFAEQGFADVSGKQIAERAGLTERTFFRHFTDKRDVLFTDTDTLDSAIVQRITSARAGLPPLLLVREGLLALASLIEGSGRHARLREHLVASLPELRERERTKHAHLEQTFIRALATRGFDGESARLAAAVGITCFRIARDRWLDRNGARSLPECFDEVLDELAGISVSTTTSGNTGQAPPAHGRA